MLPKYWVLYMTKDIFLKKFYSGEEYDEGGGHYIFFNPGEVGLFIIGNWGYGFSSEDELTKELDSKFKGVELNEYMHVWNITSHVKEAIEILKKHGVKIINIEIFDIGIEQVPFGVL